MNYQCDDCKKIFRKEECYPAKDIAERIEPGGIEQLKNIARQRRYLMNALDKLSEREKVLREEIERQK